MKQETVSGYVLVVDDYENWREQLKCILEDDGYHVETASTHAEAQRKLDESTFDVAILDMRLVDEERFNVQGLALLRKAKSQTPPIGAIILTGYPNPLHRQRALETYKADAYLQKVPDEKDFDIDFLSKLVADLVARRQER